jgi:hypothetical protein
MYSNKIKNLLINNQLLKSDFFDLKRYSFFLKKNNYRFSFYKYKKVYHQLKTLVFILKSIHSVGGTILFIGLGKKDYVDYLSFNNILKKFVIKRGHIYADSKFNGFFYNRWSLYKRSSNPSELFLNLQKNNKFPLLLFSFSKETDGAIFREFGKFGTPIIYIIEGYNHFEFKDYPLMGSYSSQMLNFYLSILQYSLK